MILLFLWDGLRPDTITAEQTPFLYKKAQEGLICNAAHAAFPTATRVNSATLATGCYPYRHGMVANSLFVSKINSQAAVSCGDWRFLKSLCDVEGGKLLHTPTLGEILKTHGKKVAFCGSGSTGTSYLSNPTLTGPVVNWSIAWPEDVRRKVVKRFGSFVDAESPHFERSRFVVKVALEYLLPEHSPDVLTVWLSEPDHTQHARGLGAPEVKGVLRELDGLLEHFLEELERRFGQEGFTCFFLSDHGFNTVCQRVDPDRILFEAGLKRSPDSNDIVFSSANLYINNENSLARLPDTVRFLQNETWVGGIFLRDDLLPAMQGIMPQSAVFSGSHKRSAALTLSYSWRSEENEHGVPGCVAGSSENRASHGSASPYDINNCFLAWGQGIRKGAISQVPCGLVDVAPTVLHLLGVGPLSCMDGRVLYEIFEKGPPPETLAVSLDTREIEYHSNQGPRCQVVRYSVVDGHRYVDYVKLL
jgi:arylsulfatase A-like enzyme